MNNWQISKEKYSPETTLKLIAYLCERYRREKKAGRKRFPKLVTFPCLFGFNGYGVTKFIRGLNQ